MDDAGAQVAADLELLAGQRAGDHPDVDLLEVERLHAHHAGRVEQQRAQPLVAEGLRADLLEDVVDPADVQRRRHRDVDDGARPVAGEVDDLHDLPVRQGDHLALEERSRVIRSVTSSIVPSAGSLPPTTVMETTSPKPYCRSVMMKKPASTSPTTR